MVTASVVATGVFTPVIALLLIAIAPVKVPPVLGIASKSVAKSSNNSAVILNSTLSPFACELLVAIQVKVVPEIAVTLTTSLSIVT